MTKIYKNEKGRKKFIRKKLFLKSNLNLEDD